MEDREEKLLMQKISRVLDECRSSNAIHARKLKELLDLRSSSPIYFISAFTKTLTYLFDFQRRTTSTERIVRFVSVFSTHRDEKHPSECNGFLEDFLRFLLISAVASNKTPRFRSCQIISEIILLLPEDAEVSNGLWDEVIDCMKLRVGDKISAIRTLAVRALARFANDSENNDIVDLFLQTLPLEQNAEVRKTIIMSFPPFNATSEAIIGCTLDVSESVRRAAYSVLGNKFPLQSLSIKLRTIILQRGLSDRSESVKNECLKMLKDAWLVKCCNGDPIVLLKFLDVETYESVGEAVMETLLKAGMVNVKDGQSMLQFFVTTPGTNEGQCMPRNQPMEPEVALYWRTLCRHLQNEAQEKATDAAATMGTEAAVYAAEASDNNDLLERILPATASDYIQLVKANLAAGPNYRFVSRQLLWLGVILDFSDATNRKVGAAFVQELLHMPLEHEVDDDGNKVVIGDGINLGGEREWATAVAELAKKVHASVGEFEEAVLLVVEELARPCRERTADYMQWMHCLAVTGLLLENVKSFYLLQGKAIEPVELLQSLLLPGAKHVNFDVQRVATRCLGLFGLLERKPSEELVKQLRKSFVKGPTPVSIMASKALVDLGMWHGPQEVDKAMCPDLLSVSQDDKKSFAPVNFCELNDDLSIELLDLQYAGLDRSDCGESTEADDHESVQAVLGEGFAKILLLSENYRSISVSLHPLIFAKLINLYFSDEAKELQRLKQCLSVLFELYPALSSDHKKCISKAFIPVMRSIWPGIYGNAGGAPFLVSNLRKRATQTSRFMLQMMQAPLYPKENEMEDENGRTKSPETTDDSEQPSSVDFDSGEEGLAIRIAAEMVSFPMKKTAAEKSYVSALGRIVFLLNFRSSEQGAIKCMRGLLNRMAESISTDKELLMELMRMGAQLKSLDEHPDDDLSQDQADLILGRLELDSNIGLDPVATVLSTPAAAAAAKRSTRPPRSRRRLRREDVSSDEGETSPTSVVPPTPSMLNSRSQRVSQTASVPPTPSMLSTRSQRASKTAALSKMMATRTGRIQENEDENDDEVSDVTSEEVSDESDEFAE